MGYWYDPVWERIRKRIADEVRTELRHASGRKLRAIVRAYDKLPFFYRHSRIHCDEELWYKRDLRHRTARDLLLGRFSWVKLEKYETEEIARKEQENIENQKLMKYGKLELSELSLEEFERLKGSKYEFVSDRRIRYDWTDYSVDKKSKIDLMDKGAEALVRFSGVYWKGSGYPVRKVRD